MIKIKPIGTFFPQDPQGFVINPCQSSNMAAPWKMLLTQVSQGIQSRFCDDIQSIYVRGSVALGCAVDELSDLDLMVLQQPNSQLSQQQLNEWLKDFVKAHQISCEIDLHLANLSSLPDDKKARLQMVLKTQSLCLNDNNTVEQAPQTHSGYQPGPAMFLDIPWLAEDVQDFRDLVQAREVNAANVSAICKVLIRAAFELVMQRANKYTRSLYWCVSCFGEFYPDKQQAAEQLLGYFLNPGEVVKQDGITVIESFGLWLIEEVGFGGTGFPISSE